MKRYKHLFSSLLILAFLIMSFVFSNVFTNEKVSHASGTGKISGNIRLFGNNNAREHLMGRGVVPSESNISYYDQVEVRLLNQDGEVIQTKISGDTISLGHFEFTDLAPGTYYVEVADQNTKGTRHLVIPSDVNLFNPENRQTDFKSKAFTVEDGTHIEHVTFVLVRKPYSVDLVTSVGHYEYTDGTGAAHSEKFIQLYPGGIYTFNNGTANYITMLGILDTDRLNNIRNSLPLPVLNKEEQDFGYRFAGWMADKAMLKAYPELEGYIFSTEEVLSIVAKDNMTFRAVFTWPTHNVTFATDSEKGLIENNAYKIVEYDGNTSTIENLPEVVAKPGYEFVGWYADMTTNIIPKDELVNMVVRNNLTFYAKYKEVEIPASKAALINPVIEDELSISGIGVPNSNIKLLLPSGEEVVTVVNEDASWKVDVDKITAGSVYTVVQTEKGKTESIPVSATAIRKTVEKSENPRINRVLVGDKLITGNGVPGASILITFNKEGEKLVTTVSDGGTWSLLVPDRVNIGVGDVVSAVQIEKDKLASSSIDATAVFEKDVETNTATPSEPIPNNNGSGTGSYGGGSYGGGSSSGFSKGNTPNSSSGPAINVSTPQVENKEVPNTEETKEVKDSEVRIVNNKIPKTADSANIYLYIGLLFVSGMMLFLRKRI